METIFDRIAARCAEMGITPTYVCEKAGFSKSFMTEIKSGRTKSPSTDKILAIANVLRVSCDYLLTGETYGVSLTEEERVLLSAWNRATKEEKENVAFILRKYAVAAPAEEKNGESVI